MSRIQQILDKAEREGRMRRTLSLDEPPPAAEAQPPAPVAQAPSAAAVARAASVAPAPPRALEPPLVRRDSTRVETPRPVTLRPAPQPAPQPGPVPTPSLLASPIVAPARTADARLAPIGITAIDPHSAIAEQYRALRTRISQSEQDRYYRAILVTSPSPGDGKSVTSLNLALAMAQEYHRRVLLVDADLRDPSLHRLLGIPSRPGLSDVLSGAAALEEALVEIPDCHLTFIPAGSPVDQPTEMLGSAEMRRLVDALRTQFDRLIFDTPPAAPLADVGVLAPLADGVIVVVRAGHTTRPAIDRAIEDIDPSHILGMVLNDVPEVSADYGYGSNAAATATSTRRHGERRVSS